MKYDVCAVCYAVSGVRALRISQRGTTDRSSLTIALTRKLYSINIYITLD